MKVLVVGSDQVFAIENFYVKYLREQSIEVLHFPSSRIFIDYYNSSLLNRLLFKAKISSIYKRINDEFQSVVKEFNPDIVWVFKGMELFPESLKWVKDRNIKLVNYNPDNPFLFSGKGSGNTNIINSLGLYDLHLTYNLSVKKQLELSLPAKAAWLPFGFDFDDELFQNCLQQEETLKLCFLGNADKKRADFITNILEYGLTIDLYGKHWEKFIRHSGATFCGSVYDKELWKVLRRYRAQLNLMRVHNEDSHNMRTFEVPAIGGIMVAPDTPDHRLFFEDGKEVFLFTNACDCSEKIKMVLQMSTTDAIGIRNAAHKRCFTSGYSYKDRTEELLRELKQLMI